MAGASAEALESLQCAQEPLPPALIFPVSPAGMWSRTGRAPRKKASGQFRWTSWEQKPSWPSSTPHPLPSSCYHSLKDKSRLTAGSPNASSPLGLPLSVPSFFTSAATRAPHPSVSRCDTAMKLAENKSVTCGTHLPPGKNVSGNEVRRMVSREQCPWPRFQLGTIFANFFFKSKKLFQIKSFKKKNLCITQRP